MWVFCSTSLTCAAMDSTANEYQFFSVHRTRLISRTQNARREQWIWDFIVFLFLKKVPFRVACLLEYPVVLFDMPVFGMDFLEILSRDLFERVFVSPVFRTAVVIRVKEGILFEDPDESYLSIIR